LVALVFYTPPPTDTLLHLRWQACQTLISTETIPPPPLTHFPRAHSPSLFIHSKCLALGFFYHEDEGDTFLWNIGYYKKHTAPHPRRRPSSSVLVYFIHKISILSSSLWIINVTTVGGSCGLVWSLSHLLLPMFIILKN
jgi:hypothetical protein